MRTQKIFATLQPISDSSEWFQIKFEEFNLCDGYGKRQVSYREIVDSSPSASFQHRFKEAQRIV